MEAGYELGRDWLATFVVNAPMRGEKPRVESEWREGLWDLMDR